MLKAIRHLFARDEERPAAGVPAGQRVYAVGDLHGRLDLFDALIDAIEADDAAAGPADTTVVLLGDLVDRGPDSAGVVARARDWQRQRKVRILTGNHEEMFLKSFSDRDMLRHFLRYGGRETVLSYGIDRHVYNAAEIEDVQSMMNACVPQEDRDFIDGFEDMIAIGDYLFVHAGILPETPFEEQERKYLRWIREPFLSHAAPHGAVVVHGHTIFDEPDDRGNRIGIDTGAYCNGRLTALVLEGKDRRYLEAIELDGAITATPRDLAA
ncbi:serine/threonine protein phosphatase [Altererythrobacter salegens]|uniref:Serine/threonine protein phosphatase n=1 Tax=Croceibacterium salegens TaxID=1737568 RepID=A0A6I4ST47_9SPHN|nr:metallophosphoesterase [Croceibacterium salegens]MXO58140.1 serine/threonine protein phosphatase [Croceibacterium salegens]